MSGQADARPAQVIAAELTWIHDHDGGRFARDKVIGVSADGQIVSVDDADGGPAPTVQLRGQAILPGFVNAHSHAFQRGLRGRGETFPDGSGSFWTWREAMYGLVERMDAEMIFDLSRQAFSEMLDAGITTVGEFHYLHHDATCDGYAFDEVVLRAAQEVGIRIVLLNAYYNTGGIGEPLSGGQKRFGSVDRDRYWAQMDHLWTKLDDATQSLGVVAHSIRATTVEDLAALYEESQRRGHVFHMHVEEQPAEIEACVEAYHCTPTAVLMQNIEVGPRFTSVHCTHTASADMVDFLEAGGNVCLCPLTEANLGDGLANLSLIERHNGSICLGSDSNARISMLEEMRWMEYGQRLMTQSRGVCVDQNRDCGPRLLESGTKSGARSLGIRAGEIRAGLLADFCTVDLSATSLRGWDDATLANALVLGACDSVISNVCVGGQWRRMV